MATEIKMIRKQDQSSQAKKLAAQIADATAKKHLPTIEPADGRYQLKIDERKLRKAVYNGDQNATIPVTAFGVPEQLVNFCTSTDYEGNQVMGQFIFERDNFFAFLLPSDLRLRIDQPLFAVRAIIVEIVVLNVQVFPYRFTG